MTRSGAFQTFPRVIRARLLSRIRLINFDEFHGLVVELGTAEPAAGDRFPTCAPLARIQNRYGDSTGQFGSCPIPIWRSGVLGHASPGT